MEKSAELEILGNNNGEILQLVTFKLGEEEFGIDILTVQEIIRLIQITPVPNAPVFVKGVMNLRGNVIPVMDLRERFKMPSIAHDSETRIIVSEKDQKIVGFLVDAVSEVLRIPKSVVEPAPAVISGVDSEYIQGIGKLEERLLILLDIDQLLKDHPENDEQN